MQFWLMRAYSIIYMSFQKLRKELPVTKNKIYLNSGHSSPTPLPILRHIYETLHQEALLGPGSVDGLKFVREIYNNTRLNVGNLINAEAGDVLLTHSTREGISIVLNGLKWQFGDEVLFTDLEHFAVSKPIEILAERNKITSNIIKLDPLLDTDQIIKIIKNKINSRTRLLVLSHIQYGCGLRMPLKEIINELKEYDILSLVDGAQSIGQIPVDVRELGCDFYAFSGQKWLWGPVGTGALYLSKTHRDKLDPLFTSHKYEEQRKKPSSFLNRFDLTSQSIGLISGFNEAIKQNSKIGIANIEKRTKKLANQLRDGINTISGAVLSSENNSALSSALVNVNFTSISNEALSKLLQNQFGIIARTVHNPYGIRFCTAYFNTENEIEVVISVLRKLIEKQSHLIA